MRFATGLFICRHGGSGHRRGSGGAVCILFPRPSSMPPTSCRSEPPDRDQSEGWKRVPASADLPRSGFVPRRDPPGTLSAQGSATSTSQRRAAIAAELAVEAHERGAALGPAEMERVGKVQAWAARSSAWATRSASTSVTPGRPATSRSALDDPFDGEAVGAAQHPFGLQQHRGRDQDVAPASISLPRPRRLRLVSSPVRNWTMTLVSIARTAPRLRQPPPHPSPRPSSRVPGEAKRSEDAPNLGRSEERRRLQQHPFLGVLDDQPGTRIPAPLPCARP